MTVLFREWYSYLTVLFREWYSYLTVLFREWYSYHFPELVKVVGDNYTYAVVARFIKDRKTLDEDSLEGLEAIVMDAAKAKMILDASRSSMGENSNQSLDFLANSYSGIELCTV